MKTMNDILELKEEEWMFGNKFNYLIMDLANDYISKSNGTDRIGAKLVEWDEEAKQYIVYALIEYLSNDGLVGFDPKELLDELDIQ